MKTDRCVNCLEEFQEGTVVADTKRGTIHVGYCAPGLTHDQLNQVMLELQERAKGVYGVNILSFLAYVNAGRILARACGIET